MYVPDHFALTSEQAREVLAQPRAANLVTHHSSGLHATLSPFFLADRGELGTLVTHLVRNNPQVREPSDGEALVIVDVADAYVSPAWYPTNAEMPNVPTWDYITVHAWGELTVHEDPAWALAAAREVTALHEPDSVLAAVGEKKLARMARAIVGVEVRLTRVVGKAKMSQNRHPVDVAGVAGAFEEETSGQRRQQAHSSGWARATGTGTRPRDVSLDHEASQAHIPESGPTPGQRARDGRGRRTAPPGRPRRTAPPGRPRRTAPPDGPAGTVTRRSPTHASMGA